MEQRLLQERAQIQEDLGTALSEASEPPAESSGNLSQLPSHPADLATAVDEADQDLRIADRNSTRVSRIDNALRRLRERPQSYGSSTICGGPIAMERLEIVPWTRSCAEHAEGARDEGPRRANGG